MALSALLTFVALTELAPPGSDEYVSLGILLALVVGVARLAVGLLGAGIVAYLLSQPLLLGFVPRGAILIVASALARPSLAAAVPRRHDHVRADARALAARGAGSPHRILFAVAVHLWRELQLEVPSWTEDETMHLRPRGVLWFTAARLEDAFLALIAAHGHAGACSSTSMGSGAST